jgi:hypothetical protein
MARWKKLSPASSRRLVSPKSDEGGSIAKTEEMRKLIHSYRGKFKLNTGGKSFSQWWAEHKREEKELEERKFQRLAALGKKSFG